MDIACIGMVHAGIFKDVFFLMACAIFFPEYKLYRNGVLEDTVTSPQSSSSAIGSPSHTLTFGTTYPGSNQYVNGAVDELSIFHAVLSDNDVNNLHNAYWNN